MNTFPLVRDMTAEIELLVAEKRRVEYGIQVNIFLVKRTVPRTRIAVYHICFTSGAIFYSIYMCPNLLLKSYDF